MHTQSVPSPPFRIFATNYRESPKLHNNGRPTNRINNTDLQNAYNLWSKNNKELADQYDMPCDESCDITFNRIRLDRIKSGLCIKCNMIHYKDNAYLVLSIIGNVYFNCYRYDNIYPGFNKDVSKNWGDLINSIKNKIFEPDEFNEFPNILRQVLAIVYEGEGGIFGEAVIKMKDMIVQKPFRKFVYECNVLPILKRYSPERLIKSHKLGDYIKSICHKISYPRTIFKPYSLNNPNQPEDPDTLNLFPGFKAIPVSSSEYNYEQYVRPWLDHMRIILCNDNIETFNDIIGFRAHLVQHPYEKPVVTHLFQSKEGTGKNTELDFFTMEVVGPQLGLIVNHINRIIGPFNALAKNQLFIVLDGTKSDKKKFKSFATQMYNIINPKGKAMYKTINYSRITNITSEEVPLPLVDEFSRNFLVQRCNNKYSTKMRRRDKTLDIEAREYFNNLHRNVFTPLGAQHIMKYLLDYDLVTSEFDPYGLPPTTDYLKELESYSESYSESMPITFLREWDWTRTFPDGGKDHMVIPCRIRDIVDEFIKWIKKHGVCVSNNYTTSRGFEKAVIKDKYRSLIQKIDRKLNNAWLYTNQNIQNKRRAIIDL